MLSEITTKSDISGDCMLTSNDIISDTRIKDALDAYVNAISSMDGVLQIYLFGSFAYGVPHEKSDIDLLVVVDDNLKAVKMSLAISSALEGKRTIPLDILVNTSSDFSEAAKAPTLQNRVKNKGLLLYAQ